MPSVLFVCTGNKYRSPIAAAYFYKLLQDRQCESGWLTGSAGTWTVSQQLLPLEIIQNAILLGLKIEGHRTQIVNDSLLKIYDLVLVMEKGHKEAIGVEFPFVRKYIYLLSEMTEGVPFDIPDPCFSPDQTFHILSEMCDLIRKGFPKIKQLAEELSRDRS